ncbi:MAG: VanZ family protein [Solobacterium sp.]|nr:VanZ family protein [Solobacterium sp.]
MKPRKHWWVWIIVLLYIYFIFSNSMKVAEASNQASIKVTWFIVHLLERIGIYANFSVFHGFVRKLAHFSEFAGLGFLVTLALSICPLFNSRFLNFLLFLIAIPVADETIQRYFAGRSSQLADMIIDGSGFLSGGILGYLFVLVIKDLFQRHKTKAADVQEQ